MNKIFRSANCILVTLIFLLLNSAIAFSQTTTTNGDITTTTYDYGNFQLVIKDSLNIEEEIQKHRDQYIDENPPSGILIDRAIQIADLESYTGKGEIIPSTNALYDQVLSELKQGGLIMPESLINPDDCEIDNIYEYEKIELRLLIALYNRLDPDGHYDEEEVGLFTSKRRLLFNGSNTVFILRAADVTFSHPDISTNSVIQIDFGDGLGFRNVLIGSNINVRYTTTGKKTIKVKVIGDNNNIFDMKCEVIVEALNYPPHHSFIITDNLPYVRNNSAIVTHFSPLIFNGTSNNPREALFKTKKPIIFVEGFDPGNENSAGAIYHKYINNNGLAECLLKNGYDIFIVDFCQNTDHIQKNAMVLLYLLGQINSRYKSTQNSNIVIGASMGGLISKYALSYMEKYNIPHETSTFITIDTPHQGANIPLGLQHALNYFSYWKFDAIKKARDNILNSVAAKQMLIYHYQGFNLSERSNLLTDFATLGMPKKCRNIAISNGNPKGIGQEFQPSELLFEAHGDLEIVADMHMKVWAVPNIATSSVIGRFDGPIKHSQEITIVGRPFPLDSAPGGYTDTFAELTTLMDNTVNKYLNGFDFNDNNYDNHCFIPTTSSLDINVADLFYNIDLDDNIYQKTPFDTVYYHKSEDELVGVPNINLNQKHVDITNTMIDWLENELTPEHLILDGSTHSDGEHKATKSITLKPGYHSKNAEIKISGALDCSQ